MKNISPYAILLLIIAILLIGYQVNNYNNKVPVSYVAVFISGMFIGLGFYLLINKE